MAKLIDVARMSDEFRRQHNLPKSPKEDQLVLFKFLGERVAGCDETAADDRKREVRDA